MQTLKALRALDRPDPIDLTMATFKDGPLTVYGFDLSPDKSNSSPCPRGVTSLEMRFSSATPSDGLVGIVMGQFHGMFTVDKNGFVEVSDRIYNL